MYIVQITSECAPVAKVGGLADVVFGLTRELEIRGHAVEIILPKYDCLRYDQIHGLHVVYQDLWVPWYNGVIHTTVFFGFVRGRKCFFIDPHSDNNFFNRRAFYGQVDDDQRFAFFCRAALEFMLKTGKHPEIIHCHDWQTGLVPVLLYEMYQALGMTHPRVCYTLHNLQHQGLTREHILRATGLHRPGHFFHADRLQDNFNPGELNLMKGGIVYSNFVTTVSPRYCGEILYSSQNFGLGHTLHLHQGKLGGILNGLDYEVWNPETDWHIPRRYHAGCVDEKYVNKAALRQRFWLRDAYKPLVCYVGRLDHQKGLDLIAHATHYCLGQGCQFLLLGTAADGRVAEEFQGLKHYHNENPDCHLELGFNEELSHLIYAGSDLIVVPSRFEPCGLTQMIGLRYGTVPVVRGIGGLADTVFDADYTNKPYHERNGYTFEHFDNAGLESALRRAIGMWYAYPHYFRQLIENGMRCDNSWNHPGQHYVKVYDFIRNK